ncbi:MAG: sigma-70 family RNA polymerase sigma factor [Oscillospiraceae bacterium]|nr:sigma-70 family RNA polymerase sigma factor [Oscillospiraceae bacterium]
MLESFYKDNYPIVRGYLLSLCGDPWLADDLTAETFLKAVEKIDTYDSRYRPSTGEKELANSILKVDIFRDAFSDDSQNFTHFDFEDVHPYLDSIIPEDAEIMEICVYGSSVHIQYLTGEMMTMLEYTDADRTGHVDQIHKLKAVTPYEEVDGMKFAGDVDEVYSLTYSVGSGLTRYEKTESKHLWFSFLDMP